MRSVLAALLLALGLALPAAATRCCTATSAPIWRAAASAPARAVAAPALPLRALVLLDPLAALFGAPGLAGLTMPLLLYRPAHSGVIRPGGNALALAAALPRAPEQVVVPGNHWVFVDPCPPAQQAEAVVCRDAPGVDRAAIHRQIEERSAAFLRGNL